MEGTNAMHGGIKFTEEKENKSINYLDLTLIKKNNRIDYEIYRKSTHTNTIFLNDYFHHHRKLLSKSHDYPERLKE